MKKLETLCTCV